MPKIHETAYIHPGAHVIGDCWIGQLTMMSPTAVCRGDEGTPISAGKSWSSTRSSKRAANARVQDF